MTRALPLLTLLTGLCGTLAAAGGSRPWFVGWLALALVVAGMMGVEEGRDAV